MLVNLHWEEYASCHSPFSFGFEHLWCFEMLHEIALPCRSTSSQWPHHTEHHQNTPGFPRGLLRSHDLSRSIRSPLAGLLSYIRVIDSEKKYDTIMNRSASHPKYHLIWCILRRLLFAGPISKQDGIQVFVSVTLLLINHLQQSPLPCLVHPLTQTIWLRVV